jgi:hypothetical protein
MSLPMNDRCPAGIGLGAVEIVLWGFPLNFGKSIFERGELPTEIWRLSTELWKPSTEIWKLSIDRRRLSIDHRRLSPDRGKGKI